jgi:DNA-binding transcriptional ArsR family regulator
MTRSAREAAADPSAGWMSVDEIAEATGLNRSSVSRRIAKFERAGLVTVRRIGGKKRVERDVYDRAVILAVDAIQSLNAAGRKRSKVGAQGNMRDIAAAQAQKVSLQADLLEIRLAELRRNFLPSHHVGEAMALASGALLRVADTLPNCAAELAAAVAKDGAAGARAFLKVIVRELRERMAAAMRSLPSEIAERETKVEME